MHFLVCRGANHSMPLDVPVFKPPLSAVPSSGIIGDSGLGGEQSYSSVSSGPPSITLDAPSLVGMLCTNYIPVERMTPK